MRRDILKKFMIFEAILFLLLVGMYFFDMEHNFIKRPEQEQNVLARCKSESEATFLYVESEEYSRILGYELICISIYNHNIPWMLSPIYMEVHNGKPLSEENVSVQWNGETAILTISTNKQQNIILELSEAQQWENAKNVEVVEQKEGYRNPRLLSQSSSEDGLKHLYGYLDSLKRHGVKVVLKNEEAGEKYVFKTYISNDLGARPRNSNCLTYWEDDTAVIIFNGEEQAECIMRISFGE